MQWAFQPPSSANANSKGEYLLPLRFRFVVGDSALIHVVDPWNIDVVGTLYPSPDD